MSKDTKDAKDLDPRLFDLRNLERNIKRGLITRKDHERYLRSLADAKDKAAPVTPTDDDDDDDDDEA